ncbi:high affinity sulfate transporter 1 [Aliiruegeria haliotis]|uniref:High affinity sulfate transporter 1 n=1 Tax=Aliiruegeria haliotis TaxID=1280846 RepID=A0A2T0RF06_9RHOB|nr:SulP family inorganic anion transporter [Aliiruegeria haliotis]PRY19680.1 high affinity sulfate transporter 1 [Aliiruegeria haliotis]
MVKDARRNTAWRPSDGNLRPDLLAGLTAAAVVLPKAMAYATVAGLPVIVGLYTAFVPMIIYAFLGSSRVLSVSSTSTLAILVATQLALAVPDGDPGLLITATATLTFLTGALLIAASLLRLGHVADFISLPVLTGFKAGIGLVIVFDQVPKLFGFHIEKEGFFRDVLSLFRHLPETSALTLAIGVSTLLLLVGMERLRPHSPAPLLVVGGGIALSFLVGLDGAGVEIVGEIPRALPSLTLPTPALAFQMAPAAIGIALMSFTETIAASRAFATQDDPPIRPDRELVATGGANLAGAFFGAMPAGGGTSQTAVVRAVGGRSQVASLVTAAAAAATMLVLAPLLGLLPMAVLAAIVIVYSVTLIQPAEFAMIRGVRKMEFLWAFAAFLGVLVFGTLQGILVAIVLSLIGLSAQAAHPRLDVIGRKRGTDILRPVSPDHPQDETFDGILILRPEGRLFFANAQGTGDRIRALIAEHDPRVVLLDFSRVFDIEYTALRMLTDGEKRIARSGLSLWIAGLNPSVAASMQASGFTEALGPERIFVNARLGLQHYLDTIGTPPRE